MRTWLGTLGFDQYLYVSTALLQVNGILTFWPIVYAEYHCTVKYDSDYVPRTNSLINLFHELTNLP
jgi:hypothetical protein